jgi:predicted ATPase
VQVGLLGALRVEIDGRPVEVVGGRLRALLTRLALEAGSFVGPSALVAFLWGEVTPNDPANALQSLVSRLRRALPDGGRLESGPAGYRLAIEPGDVDVARFERLLAEGRACAAAGQPSGAADRLRDGLDLWRGPALPDIRDLPGAGAWVARLEELRLVALEERIEADLALGRHREVIAELEALTLQHPLRERLRGQLVRALHAAGRAGEALAAYEDTRRTLADELGIDPSPQLQAVHLAVLRGRPEAMAAPSVQAKVVLPTALTSFIGRDPEVARVTAALAEGRLVTLVGPGGAGKTRLSVEAARQLSRTVPASSTMGSDGWQPAETRIVELAPLSDPDDIVAAVLRTFDVREFNVTTTNATKAASVRDGMGRLTEAFAGRGVLIVLDNCEHLIAGAAQFAEELLSRCPQLRILATSREPLGIVGEVLCPLASLARPERGTAPEQALEAASVRLFRDRARAVRPGFDVDANTVGPVVEICLRLDGLPLAIELAAARCRSLPVEVVADRLSDRFRLLAGGSRTAVARHRTLHAVVAWSWDLLGDAERVLARRLAVFAGPVGAGAVHAICRPDEGEPPEDTLDLLAALIDKSLLQAVEGPAGPRYRMLETIREFALEQLTATGELEGLRQAHARHYLDLAETAEPHLRRHEQVEWIDRLSAEHDNLLAGLRWAADTGDADTAVRLGAALAWYWTILGNHADAATWLGVALAVEGPSKHEAKAVATAIYAVSALATGALGEDTRTAVGVAADLLNEIGEQDAALGSPMLAVLGPAQALMREDLDGARAAIERTSAHPDPWVRAGMLLMRAIMAENLGELHQLQAELPKAEEGFREVGDRWGLATVLSLRGAGQSLAGDLAGAIASFEEAVGLMAELRARGDMADLRLRLGATRARAGDAEGALREIRLARRAADEGNFPAATAFADFALADLLRQAGRYSEARLLAEQALTRLDGPFVSPPQLRAGMSAGLAMLDLAEGHFAAARERLRTAMHAALSARDIPIVAASLVPLADLALREGDPGLAAEVLGLAGGLQGMDDAGSPDVRRLIAAATAELGGPGFREQYAIGSGRARAEALRRVAELLEVTDGLKPWIGGEQPEWLRGSS